MSRDKVYFLSDAHLGANYIAHPRKHEATLVAMLRQMGRDARHIYLLGDILDYWFEYRTVVPRGYIRFFGELARLVDSGVKITWIVGNHDIWLFDYLRDEIGIEVADGLIVRQIDGHTFAMCHGDSLGSDSTSFRMLRKIFRNRVCQKLYSGIHPRWTIPFAKRWSTGSRHKSTPEICAWKGDDKEASLIFADKFTRDIRPDTKFFICGHRHLVVDKKLPGGCQFVILGDCFEQFVYACWDGEKLTVKHFDTESI